VDTNRSVKESGTQKLNLKALFDAFEVPWDEEKSREVFAKVMAKLEERDRKTGFSVVRASGAGGAA
jgi:hypothetical protein